MEFVVNDPSGVTFFDSKTGEIVELDTELSNEEVAKNILKQLRDQMLSRIE